MNKLRGVIACAFVAVFFVQQAAPVHAESKKETLRKTESEREEAEEKAAKLAEKLREVEKDRASIKSDLVRITRTLQRHEKQLQKAEKREAEITREIKTREASLALRRKELVAMMAAAVRLSQVPPEAGLMMPEYSEQTVEGASSLKLMTQTIKTRAEVLRQEMEKLEHDKIEAAEIREEIDERMFDINKKRKILDAAYKEKNALASSVGAEQKQQAKRAKELAKEAGSLKQLISSLEQVFSSKQKTGKGETSVVQAASNTGGKHGKLRSFSRAKGDMHPPGSGQVMSEYSSKDGDEHSKGVTIETASSATVSAPYDGEVVFAGAFRRYGNMIILKHTDGYHTLIAGLEKIRTSTGEFLLEGEPIGAMGNAIDSRKLYVELRKDNQPIDPSSWFEGL